MQDNRDAVFTEYCRITIYLPVSNNNEIKAANLVTEKIKSVYPGITYTASQHSGIIGFWEKTVGKKKKQFHDSIQLVIIDIPRSINKDIVEIGSLVDDLKSLSKNIYVEHNSSQIEFWVTVYPILVRQSWKAPSMRKKKLSRTEES